MHRRGTPEAATDDPVAAGPPPDAPRVHPDPSVIAEARLRLTGLASRSITMPAGSEVGTLALRCGWAVLEDDEGVPFAALEVDGSRPGPGAPAAEQLLTGQLVALGEGGEPAGPFAELRLVPDRSRWAGAEAIVTRDPLDMPTLAVATPHVPLLLVVLDGLRRRPGPPAATVIRSVRAVAERVGSQGTAPVGVLVLPAPEYGDERDAALAEEIAAALGVRLLLPSRPANRRLLWDALDGHARLPDGDWPAESLSAWRSWRPPRGRRGLVLMFTGLSGSGKSTVARAVVDTIAEEGDRAATLLDGDVVRRLLSAGLGFSRADRDLNILRIGFVAAEIARHGGIAVCAPIAPFAATRAQVRAMAEDCGDFVLVHVATPLDECERRDRKGFYARARAGEIADFTGISSPYEPPDDADLVLDTSAMSVATASAAVLTLLRRGGWL
jgi:sulfate adenylyltransferase